MGTENEIPHGQLYEICRAVNLSKHETHCTWEICWVLVLVSLFLHGSFKERMPDVSSLSYWLASCFQKLLTKKCWVRTVLSSKKTQKAWSGQRPQNMFGPSDCQTTTQNTSICFIRTRLWPAATVPRYSRWYPTKTHFYYEAFYNNCPFR